MMIKHLQTKMLLLLGLLLAGVGTASATYKLTQVTSVEKNGLYVFEQSGYVMNNSVSSSSLETTDSYKTTGLEGTESYVWTLSNATNGFYMENVFLGRYLNNSSGTGVSFGSNKSSVWSFNFQDDGTVIIQNNSNGNRFLGYSSSTSFAYKAYATQNISSTSYPHAIKVFKLEEETGNDKTDIATLTSISPMTVTVGDLGYFELSATFAEGTVEDEDYEVNWTSSDPSILELTGSTYEAKAAGAVTVTVSVTVLDDETYNEISKDFTVTVEAPTVKVPGLTVDFENNLEAYVDWTFTNVGIHSTQITPHGGTYYAANVNAQGNGVASCSIATKGKVATPGILTFYISKESNNTTSSNWIVEVSEDNSNWTKVGDSQSATSMSKGEWTEVVRDLSSYTNVYVRIRYDGSNAIRAIDDISISEASAVVVKAPVFSVEGGNYTEAQTVEITCETEDAAIYYTLDGTEPTANSTEYTQAITVSETTTIKAIAIKGEDASSVVSATYTFPTIYTTIAAFMEANTTGYLNLTGAQVVYIDNDKKNIYVRDESGAIDLYNSNGFTTDLKTGDILSGTINGKYSPYKNLPEIANIADISVLTATGNETVVAKVIDGTTEAIAANLCNLVKIENTEIAANGSKYYVGDDSDIQLFDNFSVGYTVTTGKAVDVQGIATVYNDTYELFPRMESDIVYLDNSVAVSIGSAGMATFCSEEALDFSGVDAIEVYIAAVDGTDITFTQVKKVPAQTGVLLRNALGEEAGAVETINVPVLSGNADSVDGNALVGTLTEIASLPSEDGNNGANYILNNGSNGLGFYKANGKKVAAGKAYLHVANGQVRTFIGFGEETGINTVENAVVKEKAVYNLSGQRVMQPTKGLYIVGGKKVVMK